MNLTVDLVRNLVLAADSPGAISDSQKWQLILLGYVASFVVIAVYGLIVFSRSRKLAKKVPKERRRFLG
jgi:hypothetical protein